MRVTVKRDEFARLLAQASRVVETRNTIPILSHVMLNANGGAISVAATDLDIEFKDSCAAEVERSGATCVDAKMLADIVKRAAADVTLELGDQLLVKTGRSRFKLNVLPVDDFPSMEAGTFSAKFDVDLAALVGPVQFAINPTDHRPALVGTYLCGKADALVATATDGHRLIERKVEPVGEFKAIILPPKTARLVPEGLIKVRVSANLIQFLVRNSVITSKLVDAEYPPYERLIPGANDNVVKASRSEVQTSSGRVAVVSDAKGSAVKLDICEGVVTFSSRGSAEATDEIDIEYGGPDISIGFNSNYLRDVAGAFTGDEIHIALSDGMSPGLLTCPDDTGTRCVIMPMRV